VSAGRQQQRREADASPTQVFEVSQLVLLLDLADAEMGDAVHSLEVARKRPGQPLSDRGHQCPAEMGRQVERRAAASFPLLLAPHAVPGDADAGVRVFA
jgi:hypothetical protein